MGLSRILSILAVFMCVLYESELLDNGLARTPPMGWISESSDRAYTCYIDDYCVDENLIMEVADKFHSEGYQMAGFEYIIIDDCWSGRQRDVFGNLVASKKKFPRGIKFLADYIHSKGLKLGMHTSVAKRTCNGFLGSYDHYEQDAKQFAAWEIDYLKVDGCFIEKQNLEKAYIGLGAELNKTGRSIVYYCSWPYYIKRVHNETPNYQLVSKYCNVWRNTHNDRSTGDNFYYTMKYYEQNYRLYRQFHGPSHWNDPPLLIFGDDLIPHRFKRLQLVAYAMISAPLLLCCDIALIRPADKELLLNMDLMAIAKDPLGLMASFYKLGYGVILMVKHHLPMNVNKHRSVSFAFLSLADHGGPLQIRKFKFKPLKYGAYSKDKYTLYNLLESRSPVRNVSSTDDITVSVPSEGTVLVTLHPL